MGSRSSAPPSPCIYFPQRNKHNNMAASQEFVSKKHCLVHSLVLWCQTSNKPWSAAKFVQRLLQLRAADWPICSSISNRRMYNSGTLVVHNEMHRSVAAHKHPLKSSQHQQHHFIIVSCMRRKSLGGQLLQMQSLYILLKIVCLSILLQSCNGAWCLKPEEVDRLVFLAKNMLYRQQATPHVLYIYQHVMFTMQCMQMFYLVQISSGIQKAVCKQKAPFAKKYLMKVTFTLYQYQYGNWSVFIIASNLTC